MEGKVKKLDTWRLKRNGTTNGDRKLRQEILICIRALEVGCGC